VSLAFQLGDTVVEGVQFLFQLLDCPLNRRFSSGTFRGGGEIVMPPAKPVPAPPKPAPRATEVFESNQGKSKPVVLSGQPDRAWWDSTGGPANRIRRLSRETRDRSERDFDAFDLPGLLSRYQSETAERGGAGVRMKKGKR
jgi:hypothetical protein